MFHRDLITTPEGGNVYMISNRPKYVQINYITYIQLDIIHWKYYTPGGSFWCGHNIVQYHDLLPQYSSFLLLTDVTVNNMLLNIYS